MKQMREGFLIYPTFLSLGLLGFLFSSVGVTLPVLKTAFSLSVDQAGLVSALVQLGYAIFCFIGGLLADKFGKKVILVAGCLLYAVCGFGLGFPATFIANLMLYAGMGIGSGMIFISSNALVVDLFPDKRDTYLNLHHLIFAIASFLSPIVTSALLVSGAIWSTVYRWLGGISFLTGVFFFVVILHGLSRKGTSGTVSNAAFVRATGNYRQMFSNKLFLLLLCSGMLSIGSQFAIIYLLVMFLTQVRGLPLTSASAILSVYFVFLAIGRLLCSRLVLRIPPVRIVQVLIVSLFVLLFAGWLTNGIVSAVFFGLTGLACSGLMPTMLALASRILPEQVRGASLGVFSMFGGLGGMATTYGTALVAAYRGLERGFLLVIAVSGGAMLLFAFFTKRFARGGGALGTSPTR